MKAKKALKRLNKVDVLLSNVIDQCPASARGLRELLDSARASVLRAKGAVNGFLSAKKRWAAAERKGMNAVNGRPLIKTA